MNEQTPKPSILGREPVMWMALIQAGIAVAMGFGFDMTTQQMAVVLLFASALLGFIARTQVTPVEMMPTVPLESLAVPTTPTTPNTRPTTGVRRQTIPQPKE